MADDSDMTAAEFLATREQGHRKCEVSWCWLPAGHEGVCLTRSAWEEREVDAIASRHEALAAMVRRQSCVPHEEYHEVRPDG